MKQKTKNIFLIIGFILVLIIAYQYAFSTTFELRADVKQLELNYSDPQKMNKFSAKIISRTFYADSILSSNKVTSGSVQSNLLDFLNEKAEHDNIIISEFSEPHIFDFESGKSKSYIFSIQGEYRELERTLYELEQSHAFGEVINVSFQKLRNHRKQRDYLECEIVLNNFVSE